MREYKDLIELTQMQVKSFRLPPRLICLIADAAESKGIKESELVRRILLKELDPPDAKIRHFANEVASATGRAVDDVLDEIRFIKTIVD